VTLRLVAPIAGRVVALADVPDEAFAAGILGPGLAIQPPTAPGVDGVVPLVRVVAPCDGRLAKVHPHAVALETGETGVIVHLGIDTVTLHGEGFEVLVADRDDVVTGQELLRWDPTAALARGLATVTPVVVFEHRDFTVTLLVEIGQEVAAGDPLLQVD